MKPVLLRGAKMANLGKLTTAETRVVIIHGLYLEAKHSRPDAANAYLVSLTLLTEELTYRRLAELKKHAEDEFLKGNYGFHYVGSA